jgi:hypothetical protein
MITNTFLLLHVHLVLALESRGPLVRFCRIQDTCILPTEREKQSAVLVIYCCVITRSR